MQTSNLKTTDAERTRSFPGKSCLHLVTSQEVELMREALARGSPPRDLAAKLARLDTNELLHRYIAQQCRWFLQMLLAVNTGTYHRLGALGCERLMKVLAYVRKDEDAVPDYQPNGYFDDQQEVRAAALEFAEALADFKNWRLAHQVPRLWLDQHRAAPEHHNHGCTSRAA